MKNLLQNENKLFKVLLHSIIISENLDFSNGQERFIRQISHYLH